MFVSPRKIFLLGSLLTASALIAAELPIIVAVDKVYEDNLFGFNQDIIVDGVVEGDLGTIWGDLHIKGQVKGNISVLGGRVTLYNGATVEGDIVVVGGHAIMSPNQHYKGKVSEFFAPRKPAETRLLDSMQARGALFFALSALVYALTFLLFYSFPNQINEAGFEMSQDPVKTVVIGLSTLVAFFFAMFFSFLLMVLAIGVPLFVILGAAFIVISGFGLAVVFYRIAQWLTTLSGGRVSLTFSLALAILISALLYLVPVLGAWMPLVYLTLACGIVIGTRFGTNKSWFTKKSKFWAA